jgi:hypothetical protein
MTTGHNPKFIRRARAKQRADAEQKTKNAARDEPQEVVRSPQPSPEPGYDSKGKFDPDQYRIDMASRWMGYAVEKTGGLLGRHILKTLKSESAARHGATSVEWKLPTRADEAACHVHRARWR